MSRTFDAIELELLWRRLISLVDEAAVVGGDFGQVLFREPLHRGE